MKRKTDAMDVESKKKAKPSEPSRALYLGGLDGQCEYYDLCKIANQYGAIEFVKIVPAKHCAFLNFMTLEAAQAMYNAAQKKPVNVCGKDVTVGWAKSQPLSQDVIDAAATGATRNLFVAQIVVNGVPLPEEVLHQTFSKFGALENVVVMPQKGIAFVNMTSIKAAIVVQTESEQKGIEVGGHRLVVKFAKEIGVTSRDPRLKRRAPFRPPPGPFAPPTSFGLRPPPIPRPFMPPPPPTATNSRAIFLGNLPSEVTYEDLCRIGNQHGALEWCQLNPEKSNAFLNFIDPSSAASLHAEAQANPITIGDSPIRVGWAKAVDLKPDIAEAVAQGATRNLFVGGISDSTTQADLKALFDPFCKGEYDTIRIISAKKIAFVNMTKIKSAISAKLHFQNASPPVCIAGQPIKVNFAKEKVSPTRGGGGMPPRRAPYAPPPQFQPPPRSSYQPPMHRQPPHHQPPHHQSNHHHQPPSSQQSNGYGGQYRGGYQDPYQDDYQPPQQPPSQQYSSYNAYNPFS